MPDCNVSAPHLHNGVLMALTVNTTHEVPLTIRVHRIYRIRNVSPKSRQASL